MTYIVLEIKADGKIIKRLQPNKPDYEAIKKAVGGYIETIPYFSSVMHEGVYYKRGTAFADEEGMIHQKPVNLAAMRMWREACLGGDPDRMVLCGDIIFFAKVKEEIIKQERNNVHK